VNALVGIREPLPIFRDGLRAEFRRASWIVHEPRDIVAWAAANEMRHEEAGDHGGVSRQCRTVLLSLSTQRDWSVLDELHIRCPDVRVVTLLSEPCSEG
jgi:hypothetical protein